MHACVLIEQQQTIWWLPGAGLQFVSANYAKVRFLFSEVSCLIGWISDALSHGHIDLQSLVKCLDHRGIDLVLDTVCSQARAVLGCAMH